MKNMRYALITILAIVLPYRVNAEVKIKGVTVDAPQRSTYKGSIDVTFHVNMEGLDKTTTKGYGVAGVVIDYTLPANIFTVMNVVSEYKTNFSTKTTGSNEHYIASTVGNPLTELCSDKFLGCGDYKSTITLYVKDSGASYGEIVINKVTVLLSPIETDAIKEVDIKELEYAESQAKRINIAKQDSAITDIEEPTSNEEVKTIDLKEVKTSLAQKKVTLSTPNLDSPTSPSVDLSLQDLKIEGQKLAFDKDVLYYEISIPEKLNKLKVSAIPSSGEAQYTIQGADDLVSNNYQVQVVVSSGELSKTYTIKCLIEQKKEDKSDEIIVLFKYEVKRKYVSYALIFLGTLVVLIIIKVICMMIKTKFDNRKVKKALKKITDKSN